QDVVDVNTERFCHGSIDIKIKLRTVSTEGSKTDPQKTRAILRGAENLLHRMLQLAEPGPRAIFDHHLEAKGVPQAWNGRRREHGNLRVTDREKSFLKIGEEIRLGKPGRALVRVLIHDECRNDIGELR